MYATAADPNEKAFSWDTDGILFVVDNFATAIISNERRLFHGHLTPKRVTLGTADGVSTKTQIVVICRLVLTNNTNINHTYDVPGCVFDPSTPINILGIPALGTFFGDSANVGSPYDEDGTTIKLGAKRSHFICDHSKNERHFMHGSRLMPELHRYVGHGYFNAFCTRIHKLLRDKVHYAFSPAYSIDPAPPPLYLMSLLQNQETLRVKIICISGTAQQQKKPQSPVGRRHGTKVLSHQQSINQINQLTSSSV